MLAHRFAAVHFGNLRRHKFWSFRTKDRKSGQASARRSQRTSINTSGPGPRINGLRWRNFGKPSRRQRVKRKNVSATGFRLFVSTGKCWWLSVALRNIALFTPAPTQYKPISLSSRATTQQGAPSAFELTSHYPQPWSVNWSRLGSRSTPVEGHLLDLDDSPGRGLAAQTC